MSLGFSEPDRPASNPAPRAGVKSREVVLSGGYKRKINANVGYELGIQYSQITSPISRIDIGPIYSGRDYIGNTLAFDFDAKDIPNRPCTCDDKSACPKCFSLVLDKVELLIDILKQEFGEQHCLPVYSGNRGVHVWVPYSEFKYGASMRKSMCEYLNRRYNLCIDTNVTSSIYHMLKSPFSIHPSTGKVALPYVIPLMRHPRFLDIAYQYSDLNESNIEPFKIIFKKAWDK